MGLGIFRLQLRIIREAGLTFFREGVDIFWEGLGFFWEAYLFSGGNSVFLGKGYILKLAFFHDEVLSCILQNALNCSLK